MTIATQEMQEQFLAAFVECRGVLEEARQATGVTKAQFYTWMRNDDFKQRYDNYRLALAEEIESEAVKRVLSPEGQRGSDALATTLLKGLKKDRYTEAGAQNVGMQLVYISRLRDKPRPGLEGENDGPAVAIDAKSTAVAESEGPALDSGVS